ncbi:glycosyltransferase [Pseudoclavibacter sp. RFBG4]|uniref:glycosyltransferase family 4 protein n=1 Tax=Pseudoclavibacter sp. RFBG4 TaxID=2080575 RepID=UPI000CE86923|nr:glycosyltransferase family 4 protein [Pseudoclavibacter sp. RFBG4]PPG35633.1 glycosyltransferase [Pseudoclavibacter sp. RFBG4]
MALVQPHRDGAELTAKPLALWAVPVSDLAGVARHVLDVAEAGIPGYDLVVLCPEGPLAERLRALGARVAIGRFGPEAGIAASVRTLRAAASRLRPAIVHSHLSFADVIVAVTPLPRDARRVTTEHGIAGDDLVYHGSTAKSRLMAAVHTARLRRFSAAIAVSGATKAAMSAKWHPRIDIEVIPNGVDAPPVRDDASEGGAEGAGLRVLSLSRLAPEKRIDKLLEAFRLVHSEYEDARLTIAGSGELERDLRAQVTVLGLSDCVEFVGFVDPDAALRDADVLVQLSVWENCSYTLLDAAANGMRVVASNVGGNPEIVAAASLVDADDVADVARAILDEQATADISGWLSVEGMTSRLAGAYRRFG